MNGKYHIYIFKRNICIIRYLILKIRKWYGMEHLLNTIHGRIENRNCIPPKQGDGSVAVVI